MKTFTQSTKTLWVIAEKASGTIVTRGFSLLRDVKEIFDDPIQSYDAAFYEIKRIA